MQLGCKTRAGWIITQLVSEHFCIKVHNTVSEKDINCILKNNRIYTEFFKYRKIFQKYFWVWGGLIWLSMIKVWHSNLLLISVWIVCLFVTMNSLNKVQQTQWCILWSKWVFRFGIFMEHVMKKQTPSLLCFVWKLCCMSVDMWIFRMSSTCRKSQVPSHHYKTRFCATTSIHFQLSDPILFV